MRHRFHMMKLFLAAGLVALSGGCVTSQGLLDAVSDHLALTTAAAAQGLMAGWLNGVFGL